MSEQQYFVRVRGRVRGPFMLSHLQAARNNGKLLPTHEISTDQIAWKPAYEYSEVFLADASSSQSRQPIPFADGSGDGVPRTAQTITATDDHITFDCPQCGAQLKIPAQFTGRKGKCKSCGHTISIPGSDSEHAGHTCFMCGERIKAGGHECPYCDERQEGEDVNVRGAQAYAALPVMPPDLQVIKRESSSVMEQPPNRDDVRASAPEEALTKGITMIGMVYCRGCGNTIHESAFSCPRCGARQSASAGGKNKIVAGLLALFLGGIGIHRFYLGQWWGIFYLLFFWTFIPAFIAFVEALVFFFSSDRAWQEKYG